MRDDSELDFRPVATGLRRAVVAVSALLLLTAGWVQTIPETPWYGGFDNRGALMVRGWCADGEMLRPPPAAACRKDDGRVLFQQDWEAYRAAVQAEGTSRVQGIAVDDLLSGALLTAVFGLLPAFTWFSRRRRFAFGRDVLILDGRAVWAEEIRDAKVRGLLVQYLDVQTEDFDVRIGPLVATSWEAEAIAQQVRDAVPGDRRLPW